MVEVTLPRYLSAKKIRSGVAYYWQPPHWARRGAVRDGRPCPVVATALGKNLGEAIVKAEQLNEALDGWRKGETRSELAPGTVAWLFQWYQSTIKFKRLSPKTRSDYRKLMRAISDFEMKRGVFGRRNAASVDAEAADKLYEKFKLRGERQATYAMQVCRLVWNWAGRYSKKTRIPEGKNPFKGMALSHKVAEGNLAATRAQYDLYRQTARELGFQSMASAAALAFEFVQRVSDVFGFEDPADPDADDVQLDDRGIRWEHYRAGDRIIVRQHKTNKLVTIPLSDGRGTDRVSLYPEVEEELARWRQCQPAADGLIIVEERTGKPYKHRRMSDVHRRICDTANLPKKLTFTSFRHGGATEIGDSGEADIRPISGHTQINTTAIYNKVNQEKARRIAVRRREHIATISGQDEDGGRDE